MYKHTGDLSRLRLVSGTEPLLRLLAKAGWPRFKDWGNRLHFLIEVVATSHAGVDTERSRVLEPFFLQSFYHTMWWEHWRNGKKVHIGTESEAKSFLR